MQIYTHKEFKILGTLYLNCTFMWQMNKQNNQPPTPKNKQTKTNTPSYITGRTHTHAHTD